MSLLGKLVKTAVNVALLPVDVAKDVATLGGSATEQNKSYTEQRLERMGEDADDE